ncbi:hypothetical protein HK097_004113 [Rhizophlyctis rosea]|uniref:Uncharacterized protein n=1 Tax=Rhizophlyctis rosea TaxID=64517 RepID=A0AAD5X617_9FUNG|nr:hypothetical protein HK097_004113 [Rhizophlyctis rosea]
MAPRPRSPMNLERYKHYLGDLEPLPEEDEERCLHINIDEYSAECKKEGLYGARELARLNEDAEILLDDTKAPAIVLNSVEEFVAYVKANYSVKEDSDERSALSTLEAQKKAPNLQPRL